MEFLTVDQVAEMLQVNPLTVRRYIERGTLPAVRVGRRVRVHREAIQALLQPIDAKGAKNTEAGCLPGERATSAEDPLWQLIGIGESPEPTDASRKHEYLAEAHAPNGR